MFPKPSYGQYEFTTDVQVCPVLVMPTFWIDAANSPAHGPQRLCLDACKIVRNGPQAALRDHDARRVGVTSADPYGDNQEAPRAHSQSASACSRTRLCTPTNSKSNGSWN